MSQKYPHPHFDPNNEPDDVDALLAEVQAAYEMFKKLPRQPKSKRFDEMAAIFRHFIRDLENRQSVYAYVPPGRARAAFARRILDHLLANVLEPEENRIYIPFMQHVTIRDPLRPEAMRAHDQRFTTPAGHAAPLGPGATKAQVNAEARVMNVELANDSTVDRDCPELITVQDKVNQVIQSTVGFQPTSDERARELYEELREVFRSTQLKLYPWREPKPQSDDDLASFPAQGLSSTRVSDLSPPSKRGYLSGRQASGDAENARLERENQRVRDPSPRQSAPATPVTGGRRRSGSGPAPGSGGGRSTDSRHPGGQRDIEEDIPEGNEEEYSE